MKGFEIKSVFAREILDSRGNPTVEASVYLESGAVGIASVPSGASTGAHEAYELRDKEKRYGGKGVLAAVESVNKRIAPSLIGVSALDQLRIDCIMIALDATHNKSNLGANAILSVSLAAARAAAAGLGLPLYRYIGGSAANTIPVPMMNILNGGVHAGNNIDIQEFMIVPRGASSFSESVRMCAEIYYKLRSILSEGRYSTAVGDEGGFAPNLASEREALDLICRATEAAGYRMGEEIFLALDVASSEWYSEKDKLYKLPKSGAVYTAGELSDMLSSLLADYPIISVEDGMAEDDIEGWRTLTERARGKELLLVGDDLFVTSKQRLIMGVKHGIANAILIKPNQIGTVSEVCEVVEYARSHGYKCIMSHRSGETADTFIADLAVALGCELIKSGAPSRSERTEKYNRLMAIEAELFSPIFRGEQ